MSLLLIVGFSENNVKQFVFEMENVILAVNVKA